MEKRSYEIGFCTNFEYIKANFTKTQKFTLLYTHGFCSDPWGRKPEEIKKWCLQNNISFFRYELAGHGSDKARFEEADINIWKAQLLEIVDQVIEGPVVFAGSSLGGWLSMLAARERPDRAAGLIGLAAAPDFTKDNETMITPAQKQELETNGKIFVEGTGLTYVITKQLVNSGSQNLLLDKPYINVFCPVVLIQGMKDTSVLWQKAVKIAEKLRSPNVVLKLLKNSDHRLNEDSDIKQIRLALDSFL